MGGSVELDPFLDPIAGSLDPFAESLGPKVSSTACEIASAAASNMGAVTWV